METDKSLKSWANFCSERQKYAIGLFFIYDILSTNELISDGTPVILIVGFINLNKTHRFFPTTLITAQNLPRVCESFILLNSMCWQLEDFEGNLQI
jgi:hypothetical protein